MFSFGKLVDYKGPYSKDFVGRIAPISPNLGKDIFFHLDQIYQYSKLIEKPSKVKRGSYVVYNLSGNPPDPVGLPLNLIALIDEVKPASLWRLMIENNHKGYIADSIIKRYCPDEVRIPIEKTIERESIEFRNKPVVVSKPSGDRTDSDLGEMKEYFDFLTRRGVKYFVHFTATDNLDGIFREGLKPRKELDENCVVTDDKRIDCKPDSISLSFSFPNYRMFFSKRKEMKSYSFVVLRISIDALKDFRRDAVGFYPANGASTGMTMNDFADHCTLDSLKMMFAETSKRQKNLPKEFTTDPQAEVMIKGTIPAKYIKEIVFESPEDLMKYRNKYTCHSTTDRRMFRYRSDYKVWQKQDVKNDAILIGNPEGYIDDFLPF